MTLKFKIGIRDRNMKINKDSCFYEIAAAAFQKNHDKLIIATQFCDAFIDFLFHMHTCENNYES